MIEFTFPGIRTDDVQWMQGHLQRVQRHTELHFPNQLGYDLLIERPVAGASVLMCK